MPYKNTKHSEHIYRSVGDEQEVDRFKKLEDSLNNPSYISRWEDERNVVKPTSNDMEVKKWDK